MSKIEHIGRLNRICRNCPTKFYGGGKLCPTCKAKAKQPKRK